MSQTRPVARDLASRRDGNTASRARRLCIGVAGGVGLLASGLSHADIDLEHYAVLAKIESNLAEIGSALAMHVINEGEGDYGEDFKDDVDDVERYLGHLERLTADARMQAEIATYRSFWERFAQEGHEIHDAIEAGMHLYSVIPQLNAWHASVEELDDFTDKNLDAILDAAGISLESDDSDDERPLRSAGHDD